MNNIPHAYYTCKLCLRHLTLGRSRGYPYYYIFVVVTNTMGNLRQVDLIKITINEGCNI